MRIRKGHRCVPADRSSSQEGSVRRDAQAPTADDRKDDANQASGAAPGVAAATSDGGDGGSEYPVLANGASSAGGTERLELDRGRKRLSADKYSSERPLIAEEGMLSISAIIRAGMVEKERSTSTSAPASADSVVTSNTSLVVKSAPDCSPPVATKPIDQPNLLLQSLKRVCSTAGNTGLTAKEAVAKILERGLPGLNQGGERLIVQVAKAFRSSSVFVEREERGRYFLQDASPIHEECGNPERDVNVSRRGEKPVRSSATTEFDKAVEAAKQLQNLQRIEESLGSDRVGFTGRDQKENPVTDRRVVTLKGKSGARVSTSSQKTALARDQSGPRCNRDDGKGWRCFRPAELGFSLCKYHRDQIRRAEIRRRRAKNKPKERHPVKPHNPITSTDVVVMQPARRSVVPKADKPVEPHPMASDDELPDQKRRRFVKAKSLKSLL